MELGERIAAGYQHEPSSLNAPGNINRPNVNGSVNIPGGIGPGTLYFDKTKFSAPAPNTFGNLGRNVLHGPGINTLDASIFRRFPIRERMNVEFRAEAFNLTNTPQYNRPDSIFHGRCLRFGDSGERHAVRAGE